jgi:hypothetical protein
MHLWNYFLSNVDALKIHCKNLIIIGLKYIFGNSLLTDYCNFSYSEHLLRSWVFLKPQTEGFGKVQLNVIFFSTISFPLRKPFSFPLGTISSFFCSFFSVFQTDFFLSLRKNTITISFFFLCLRWPSLFIFISICLFPFSVSLLSSLYFCFLYVSPPFPLLCPCSTSIEIRRKYFHLTREEQIERALWIKKHLFK